MIQRQISQGDDDMAADIIILALVLGYCAFVVYKMIRGRITGEGNPFSCTGDCRSCLGACSNPEQQEKFYREVMDSIEEKRKMNGTE